MLKSLKICLRGVLRSSDYGTIPSVRKPPVEIKPLSIDWKKIVAFTPQNTLSLSGWCCWQLIEGCLSQEKASNQLLRSGTSQAVRSAVGQSCSDDTISS